MRKEKENRRKEKLKEKKRKLKTIRKGEFNFVTKDNHVESVDYEFSKSNLHLSEMRFKRLKRERRERNKVAKLLTAPVFAFGDNNNSRNSNSYNNAFMKYR